MLADAVATADQQTDLLPTPPELRTWVWWNYFFFYFALSMDNWTLGSTMVGIGLNWWQSILVVFGSQMISSIAMCFNSREGEVYHIGYPVVSRSVFGTYGAFYVVFARSVLAVVYYGIKLYIGSGFVVSTNHVESEIWLIPYLGEYACCGIWTLIPQPEEPSTCFRWYHYAADDRILPLLVDTHSIHDATTIPIALGVYLEDV